MSALVSGRPSLSLSLSLSQDTLHFKDVWSRALTQVISAAETKSNIQQNMISIGQLIYLNDENKTLKNTLNLFLLVLQIKIHVDLTLVGIRESVQRLVEDSCVTALWDSRDQRVRVRNTTQCATELYIALKWQACEEREFFMSHTNFH